MAKQIAGAPDPTEETRKCDKHGEYTCSIYDIGYGLDKHETHCPECMRLERIEQERKNKREFYAERQHGAVSSFTDCGLPKRFENKIFDSFEAASEKQKRALETCRRYAENFQGRFDEGGGLILCGKAGTGKTHLASAIINRVQRDYHTALFISTLAAIRHVKQTYGSDSHRTEGEAIRDFVRADLVVFDEVGVQFGSDAEKIIFFEIINNRYQHVRPTVLISNLTLAELSNFVGERVIDRMHEGGGVVLSFDWGSHRRPQ